ncbi:MAG: class I SAM-dependent methyltransferase [Patescibacteria group bacterium]|nr:class I SAM-dependent methyltransferase [Patescibacteria group bacterium]
MSSFFDILAPVYDVLHIGSRRTFRNIEKIAEFTPVDVVVDVGGGAGRIARFLVGRVARVIVLDPSEGMVRQCRKREGLECVLGGAEKIPCDDSSVDKIILVDAFHHISAQLAAVREMRRVLKPGGKIIFEEFNPETLGGKYVMVFEWLFRMGSTFYTPAALARLFSEHDFEVRVVNRGRKAYYAVARRV